MKSATTVPYPDAGHEGGTVPTSAPTPAPPEQVRRLTEQARTIAQAGDIAGAIRVLTDTCTSYPPYEPALLLMLDCLCAGWFPPPESLQTAFKLMRLAERAFPDSAKVRESRTLLEKKQAQIQAVQRGNREILQFKDRHTSERCVIIGNGPSLNTMDLSFLKHETCFGLNRIYIAFERYDFVPTYLVSVNRFVLEQSAADFQELPCTKFLSFEGVPAIHPDDNLIVINPRTWEDFFSTDPRRGLCIGSTVTYVAMQLAFWMGFEEVVLIGVDHRFTTRGAPHKIVESQGDDPNHFDPNYFGKGYTWQLPDLKNSEQMYRIADAYFRAYRGKIIDATVNGACPVFEKADYRDVFF
jgi:hypothetical protein